MQNKNIEKALKIAYKAHENQFDKGGEPYINHPLHIAKMLNCEDEIITALLHDVMEDTNITKKDLIDFGFNENVINALSCLTRKRNEDYFSYINKIKSNILAKKIKILDLEHNLDIKRLSKITNKDLQRIEKYKKALAILKKDR